MTESETVKLFMLISAAYPNFKVENKTQVVKMWTKILEEYSYLDVEQAVIIYIKTDSSGFAPSVGEIISRINYVDNALIENEFEAWSLVRKAIRDSGREPEKVFANLPKACRMALGNVSNLVELGLMDSREVETVEQSHFMKAYRVAVGKMKEESILPVSVSMQLESKRQEKLPQLVDKQSEVKERQEDSQMTTDMNEQVKKFLKDNFGYVAEDSKL